MLWSVIVLLLLPCSTAKRSAGAVDRSDCAIFYRRLEAQPYWVSRVGLGKQYERWEPYTQPADSPGTPSERSDEVYAYPDYRDALGLGTFSVPQDATVRHLWVRDGYTLEVYPEEDFGGGRTDLSAADGGEQHRGGTLFSFSAEDSPTVRSYRCRVTGTPLSEGDAAALLIPAALHHFPKSQVFERFDGGNHPGINEVRLFLDGGELVATVETSSYYGMNADSAVINLTAGAVEHTARRNDSQRWEGTWRYSMAEMDDSERASLAVLQAHIADIARGQDTQYNRYTPPMPELAALADWLQAVIER